MHYPLWNPFVVEVKDLLSHHEVLKQLRTPRTNRQGVLTIGNDHPLSRRHRLVVAPGDLVRLTARSSQHLLVRYRDLGEALATLRVPAFALRLLRLLRRHWSSRQSRLPHGKSYDSSSCTRTMCWQYSEDTTRQSVP